LWCINIEKDGRAEGAPTHDVSCSICYNIPYLGIVIAIDDPACVILSHEFL